MAEERTGGNGTPARSRWKKWIGASTVAGGALVYQFGGSNNDVSPEIPPIPMAPALDKSEGHLTEELLMQAEANRTYRTLHDKIATAIDKSKRDGKKLHVLLGEDHGDKHSLMLEIMVLTILRDLDPNGIGSVLHVEMGPSEKDAVKQAEASQTIQLSPAASMKLLASIHAHMVLDYKIAPTDPPAAYSGPEQMKQMLGSDAENKVMVPKQDGTVAVFEGKDAHLGFLEMTLRWRNQEMATDIAASGKSSVSIVGGCHLQGIAAHLEKDNKITVLPIVASNILKGLMTDDPDLTDISAGNRWLQKSYTCLRIPIGKVAHEGEATNATYARMAQMVNIAQQTVNNRASNHQAR